MKRFLLTGLLILGLGQFATYAQQRGTYTDDIYYNSKDAKKEAEIRKQKAAEAAAARQAARANEEQERENTYSSSGDDAQNNGDGDATTYKRSYQTDADVDGDGYLDANDDYFYASRVRRFNNNSWGGYYSPFYDPFWYGPGYYGGSGVSVTIGWGWGPSWGYGPGWGYPYGGWGYPYGWGYPSNGWGYCGPGWGYGYGYPYYGGGYWSGYNHGFYDGYHYGGGGYGAPRSVYGPRRSLSSNSYGPRGNGGSLPSSGGLIRQQRNGLPDNGSRIISNDPPAVRSTRELPGRAIQNPNGSAVERSRRFEPAERDAQPQMQERRMQRNRIFGGQSGQMENSRRFEQREQPAMEQRSQRSYEPQRYQQSAPSRMQSSPSMNSPRGGSFGSGSSSFGGGGGSRRR